MLNPDPAIDVAVRAAIELDRAGRATEAIAAYQRALALEPNLPNCWYNLGFLQRRTGKFSEALASYQKALEHHVNRPEEVHLNRAVIYSDDLLQPDQAARELDAALADNPNFVSALLNLGNLREDFGQRAEAKATYERVLALEPELPAALARYAGLVGPTDPNDPLIARLKAAIANPKTMLAERATLSFALGRLLDACGSYEQAFASYKRANLDSRMLAGPKLAYDRASHEALIDTIIAAFPGLPATTSDKKSRGATPIFICGKIRSGSTLTEQILAAHPRVTAGGELNILPNLVARELSPFPEEYVRTGKEKIPALAESYQAQVHALFPHAEFVTDKRPDNYFRIGLIKRMFPHAKIIHTLRNPPDNCLSIYFLNLDYSMNYAFDLMDIAHHYRQYRRLMDHWQALYGDDILTLEYDALVREPRPQLERLLGYLGLEWNDACLNFERNPNAVKTASVWQVREPLYQRSSGRWRHYAAELEPVRQCLSDLSADG